MRAEAPVCHSRGWAAIKEQAIPAAELNGAARRAPNLVPFLVSMPAGSSLARAAAIEVGTNPRTPVLWLAARQEARLARERIVNHERAGVSQRHQRYPARARAIAMHVHAVADATAVDCFP